MTERHVAHKADNTYHMALYRSLHTPGLGPTEFPGPDPPLAANWLGKGLYESMLSNTLLRDSKNSALYFFLHMRSLQTRFSKLMSYSFGDEA